MADPKVSQALGVDDYRWLFEHLTSADEGQRKQAQQLAGKLTPSEAQEFFDFQHAANGPSPELHREDNSLLGMPPELAVAGGIGVARTVAGAGAGLLPKATAVAKTVALPAVKEEMTRRTLESFGVPRPIAAVIGGLVAGYGMKSAAADATAGEVADATALRAKATQTLAKTPENIVDSAIQSGRAQGAATAAAAPSAVVPAPPLAVDMAGQPSAVSHAAVAERSAMKAVTPKVFNEFALAARRNKIALAPDDYNALVTKVQSGMAPADAVAELASSRAAASPAAELARRLGTKTDAEVAADMRGRYERGQKSLSGYAAK